MMDGTPYENSLWVSYWLDRSTEHRNAIICHYLGTVQRLAASIADRMGISDPEDYVAECLLHILAVAIPHYDGRCPFLAYCSITIRRRICAMLRHEKRQPIADDTTVSLLHSRRIYLDSAIDIADALEDLTERQRVVAAARMASRTYREIEREDGIPAKTAQRSALESGAIISRRLGISDTSDHR